MSQDVPPFMMVDGNPLAVRGFNVEGLRRRGFSRRAHRRGQADAPAAVPRGPDAGRGARRDRRAAPSDARGGAPTSRLMQRLPRRAPRAASSAEPSSRRWTPTLRGSRWSPAKPRATCSPACCSTACARAGRRCVADGIGGPQMVAQRLRRLVAARQAGGARLRRGAAPLPRDRSASATQLGRAPARATGPTPSSASTRPTSTSTSRRGCKARGIKTVHFVCPSIWAWRGKRIEKIARGRRPRAVHLPVRARAATRSTASPATYVGHPLANAIPLEPPRAAARAALGIGADDDASSRCCRAAGARRSSYIAPRLFGAAAADAAARGPACASSLPVVAGPARR